MILNGQAPWPSGATRPWSAAGETPAAGEPPPVSTAAGVKPPMDAPAASETKGLFARGLRGAVWLSVAAVQLPMHVVRPLILSWPLRPARDVADAALRRVVDALASVIAEQLQHNLELQALIETMTARVLKDLMTQEGTARLVLAQVHNTIGHVAADSQSTRALVAGAAEDYLSALAQSPAALRPLVRGAAGDYIAHLTSQPETVNSLVEVVAGELLISLRERPLLVEGLVRSVADGYVAELAQRTDTLAPLIEQAAGSYIASLQENAELLDPLVQRVADRYLGHLREHPDEVQKLLNTQSVTVAGEAVGEVRARAAAADSSLENIVRGLLRRPPRTEIAPSAAPQVAVASGERS